MKKFLSVLLLVVLSICSIGLSSCNKEEYTVTIVLIQKDGNRIKLNEELETLSIKEGETIGSLDYGNLPYGYLSSYTFIGYYIEKNATPGSEWNLVKDEVTCDFNLYVVYSRES